MENTTSSNLLPAIKCSNCAADIQISLITDHVCSVNGYLTPAEYTSNSNMMSSDVLPGANFLRTGPQTPSSILSSPASPDHLSFSNNTKIHLNTLSDSLTPPESLSPNKSPVTSGLPTPRETLLRLKLVEEQQRIRTKNQERTSISSESNEKSAEVYPKSTDNSEFFLRIEKIAPGPFDISGKRDLFKNVVYDNDQKKSVGNLNDMRTRKASYGEVDFHPTSARGHFYKNSGGSISSKTNYAILPKVPRKNGYDGFGPPNRDNNRATKLRSSSDSQNLSLNNQLSPRLSLMSDLELAIKIKPLVDQTISKIETLNYSESLLYPETTLPQGFNGRKKDYIPPISPLDITDELSLPPPQNKIDNLMPKTLQENIGVLPLSPRQKKLDKSLLILPKIKLPPLPPKESNNRLPSSLPQKSSNKSLMILPKIKAEKLPPLPPLSPLPPKENYIKPPSSLTLKNSNKPSLLLPQIKTSKLPPLPPKERYDELSLFPTQQYLEKKKSLGNYIEEKTQLSSLENSIKIGDLDKNPVFSLSNSKTPVKHSRKRSDLSQLENLMADIQSSMSDLDLNEDPFTRSSSYYLTQLSIPTASKFINDSNILQISNVLSSPSAPTGIPQTSSSVEDSNNRPNFPEQNSLPILSTPITLVDRVTQSGLPSNRSPRPQTHSISDNHKLSKGTCKKCGEEIYRKSVSSADGRLTGRYHKECFVCKICLKPFNTASCYVINDAPYCETHYHKINGSNCSTCTKGIEGKYIETDRGQKHHPDCFRCSECRCVLQNNYFEMGGLFYCERDVYQLAEQKRNLNSNIDGKDSQMESRSKSLVMI